VIDKIDKLPAEVIATMLADEAGLTPQQTGACLALADIRSADSSFVDRVRALGISDPLLDEGLSELAEVIDGCAAVDTDRFTVEADLSIARGLDYYTGTVFETRMAGFESLGSICSGGRYDSLASDGRTSYPGVGISLGVTRLLTPLFARKKLTASRSVPSAVLVALPDEQSRRRCGDIAQSLRSRGIATEVSPLPQKYGKQIRFAERRGIPFVWFPASSDADSSGADVSRADGGTPHEVKDIRSGEQVVADPSTWEPPLEDLRPQVVQPGL
jgi:histidyl-tRNA synthetase